MSSRSLLNTSANLVGRLACAVASFVAVPLVVGMLGAEAFGIVSFALALQALVALFDMGLSAAIKREIAGSIALDNPPSERRSILRTFEIAYWAAALIVGGVLISLASVLAQKWLKLTTTSPEEAANALRMGAVVIALRWPSALYGGVLLAQESQIEYNMYNSGFFILRALGSVAAVKMISPTLETYFSCFIAISVIETLTLVLVAWRRLGVGGFFRCQPSWAIIRRTWHFAFAFSLVGALGMLTASLDKFILASKASVSALGAYALAGTPAGMLLMIGAAVSVALFPEAAGFWATGNKAALARNLARSTGRVLVSTLGVALVLIFASDAVMSIWLAHGGPAREAARCLPWLAVAFLFNSLGNPSYTLLVACGRTRLSLTWNAVNLLVTAVMLVCFAHLGATAVAVVVAITNATGAIVMAIGALRLCGMAKFRLRSSISPVGAVAIPIIAGLLAAGAVRSVPALYVAVIACILAGAASIIGLATFEHQFKKC